jgi:hypothetical protein
MTDKRSMVQRIGKDSAASGEASVQNSKRQDERSIQERAAKFRAMLGQNAQRDAEAAENAKRTAGGADGAGGPGRSGPGTQAEVAAAAKEMQAALEEMGVKATQARGGKSPGEEAGGDGSFGAQLLGAGPAGTWGRPEGPSRVESATRLLPTELEGMEKMHRLLIGQGPAGAEARLSITDGPLAGSEIHLRTGPGGVQAAVSTSTSSARQTLASAMEEVATRLRDKGHRLNVKMAPPPTRPEHSSWPPPKE